jgi:curved DNA-binding protein CbpA
MDDILTCYQIIGVQPGTSPKALKKAYRDLVKRWHPDRFPGDSEKRQEAEEKLKSINLAFERIQDHRETLIALAARRSPPAPASSPSRPRASSAPPRPPRPRTRPHHESKPPRPSANKAPRAQAATTPFSKPAPRKNFIAAWFARRLRPATLAAGFALLGAASVTFLFVGRKDEPLKPERESEPTVPLSQIEFRAFGQASGRSPAAQSGEIQDVQQKPRFDASEPSRGSRAMSLVGTDSTPSLTLLRDQRSHIRDAVERVPTNSWAVNSVREPGELPTTRGGDSASPLINDSLKAKLIAKAEAPRSLPPRPEETPEGQVRAALRFAQGDGAPRDYAEAARLYRLAAEAAHPEAQKNLGFLYAEGKGVPQDSVEAAKCFEKAAAQGIAGAKFARALLAHAQATSPNASAPREAAASPATVPEDGPRSALLKGLFRSNSPAANSKEPLSSRISEPANPEAQYALGLRCENGDGLKQDFATGREVVSPGRGSRARRRAEKAGRPLCVRERRLAGLQRSPEVV